MPLTSDLYRDLAYVFAAALLGGIVARRLRQPLILGYVLGGILIGPFTPGPTVSDVHALELFAEIGVILLMYSVGVEFSLRDLLKVKWIAIIGGPLGIILSMALSVGVGRALGWSPAQGIAVGAVISVASTMVLARLLIDRGMLNTQQGRIMIGITLVEDFAVVALTVLLPALGSGDGAGLPALGLAFGKALLILIPAIVAAARLVPPLMARIAETENRELHLLVALALGFVTAAVTQAVGLSLALGAFLAGILISGSEHAHATLDKLLPLRDAFVALFFVTIGSLIDPRALIANVGLLGVIVGLIVLGKFVVWAGLVRAFGYPFETAMLVAIGLTQVGEFSYVLVRVARDAGLVGTDVYNATLGASLLTILLNVTLMRLAPEWLGRRPMRLAES